MIDNKDNPIEYPIDGTLDLHQFSPKETRSVVYEYIEVCRKNGIFNIRIVHGKGQGVQRRIVHSILENLRMWKITAMRGEAVGVGGQQ